MNIDKTSSREKQKTKSSNTWKGLYTMSTWGCALGMQDPLHMWKSVNRMNSVLDRNHMARSINAEKLLSNPITLNDENSQWTRKRRGLPQSDKGHLQNPTAESVLSGGSRRASLRWTGTRPGRLLSQYCTWSSGPGTWARVRNKKQSGRKV